MARDENCYCCPYGGFLAVPAIMAGLATMLTYAAANSCNFFHISTSLDLSGAVVTLRNQTVLNITDRTSIFMDKGVGVGFWWIENPLYDQVSGSSVCLSYPAELQVDGAIRFARMMAVIGKIMAFMSFILILVPSCVNFDKQPYFKYLAGSFFALAIITILYLVSMASGICQDAIACSIAGGGVGIIFASLFWLLTGCLTLYVKPKPRPPHVAEPSASTNGSPPPQDMEVPVTPGTLT